jgi:aminopeptidase YwaD
MRIFYIFSLIGFFLLSSFHAHSQQKSYDLLNQISEEVNQDSLTSYILSMQNLGTRYALAENRKDVARWIKRKFESFGYQNVMLDSFVYSHYGNETMQYNVICKSDSVYVHDDYVLLGAHHDAITYASPMDSTPGADDNASGVAGVLEAARVLKMYGENTKIPFHFATWAAEEYGLHGSKHYVQTHVATNDLPLFYINLDMIANSTNGNRRVNYSVTGGLNYFLTIASNYSELVPVSATSTGGSDHMPFNSEQVPILYFHENNFSEYYHSENDRLENLEIDYASEVVKGTVTSFYFGANANPLVEIKYVVNGGTGENFIVGWELQEEAIGYKLDVFQDDVLIKSMETDGDSLYVDGLPLNERVCFELYSLNSDSVGGYRVPRCVDLSATPDPLQVSSIINLNHIIIEWDNALPQDADKVIVERKRKDDSEFELYGEIDPWAGSIEFMNHETGIWQYQLTVRDLDGLVSTPTQTIIFSTPEKNDIMVVSGQLGGYNNPTNSDVLSFYENILPKKDYHLFSAVSDKQYLPIMQNMEVLIWNAFSSNYSKFYENLDLLKSYIENGGKLLLFGINPQLHFDPSHPDGVPFMEDSWTYNVGITDILANDGARLKQLRHTSGLGASVNPDKVFSSFNGTLPNVDAMVTNENASVVLTYQSLSESVPENNFDGEPIAIKYQNENSSFIICGVPLYYFMDDESEVLLKKLLEDEMMVSNPERSYTSDIIHVYPNPTKDNFYIKNQSSDRLNGVFSLTDISGRLIRQIEIDIDSGDSKQCNFELLPGIYFLSNDQLSLKTKLIVN